MNGGYFYMFQYITNLLLILTLTLSLDCLGAEDRRSGTKNSRSHGMDRSSSRRMQNQSGSTSRRNQGAIGNPNRNQRSARENRGQIEQPRENLGTNRQRANVNRQNVQMQSGNRQKGMKARIENPSLERGMRSNRQDIRKNRSGVRNPDMRQRNRSDYRMRRMHANRHDRDHHQRWRFYADGRSWYPFFPGFDDYYREVEYLPYPAVNDNIVTIQVLGDSDYQSIGTALVIETFYYDGGREIHLGNGMVFQIDSPGEDVTGISVTIRRYIDSSGNESYRLVIGNQEFEAFRIN